VGTSRCPSASRHQHSGSQCSASTSQQPAGAGAPRRRACVCMWPAPRGLGPQRASGPRPRPQPPPQPQASGLGAGVLVLGVGWPPGTDPSGGSGIGARRAARTYLHSALDAHLTPNSTRALVHKHPAAHCSGTGGGGLDMRCPYTAPLGLLLPAFGQSASSPVSRPVSQSASQPVSQGAGDAMRGGASR
jgi:hypothetical protein